MGNGKNFTSTPMLRKHIFSTFKDIKLIEHVNDLPDHKESLNCHQKINIILVIILTQWIKILKY